jgi:TorA maturation chaperone TorD
MKAQLHEKVEGDSLSTFTPSDLENETLLPLRQFAYRFFGSLFLYPDEERLQNIQMIVRSILPGDSWRGQPFSPELERLLIRLDEIDIQLQRRDIVNEYNRLFLIRALAPPHETYYTDADGQFRGKLTSDLAAEYLEAGLELATDLNELPDHISVELEFMSFLCDREILALDENRVQDGKRYWESQRKFVGQHLARWFPKMALRVREANPEHLYALVLQAAYAFLRHDLEYLGIQD